MSDVMFGERVLVNDSNVLHRHHNDGLRQWRSYRDVFGKAAQPHRNRVCLFLGWRTVSDGCSEFNGWDEPVTYFAHTYYRVALVCSEGRNPVYVRPGDLEEAPDA